MPNIRPGQEVDPSLSSPELLDVETQNWFNLLHHYESDMWDLPAPTEGQVNVRAGWEPHRKLQLLGSLPTLGELVLPEGSILTVGISSVDRLVRYGHAGTVPIAHALRKGFWNPADNREYPVREARSITPIESEDSGRKIEVGLGFAFSSLSQNLVSRYDPSRSRARYKITLSQEGDDSEVVARRIEGLGDNEHVTEEIRGVDHDSVRSFMQVYRDTMWETVFEPA